VSDYSQLFCGATFTGARTCSGVICSELSNFVDWAVGCWGGQWSPVDRWSRGMMLTSGARNALPADKTRRSRVTRFAGIARFSREIWQLLGALCTTSRDVDERRRLLIGLAHGRRPRQCLAGCDGSAPSAPNRTCSRQVRQMIETKFL